MWDPIEQKIIDIIDSKKDEIIAFGDDIWHHAELGYKEVRTAGKYCEWMKKLGLENVDCVHMRAEDGGADKNLRESFDLCISRAVANLAVLSEYCLPFVRVGGTFISMKGPDVEEEVNEAKKAIKVLGGEIKAIKKMEIPETDIVHSLIFIEKVKPTPSKYPRKAGKAKKEPIM